VKSERIVVFFNEPHLAQRAQSVEKRIYGRGDGIDPERQGLDDLA
jgi:hypothetical protein